MTKPEPQTYYSYGEVREWIKQQHGINISDYRNRHGKLYNPSVDYLCFGDIIMDDHLLDEGHNGVLVTIDHTWETEEMEAHEDGQGRAWVLHCLKLIREEFGSPHPTNPEGWFVDIYYWW